MGAIKGKTKKTSYYVKIGRDVRNKKRGTEEIPLFLFHEDTFFIFESRINCSRNVYFTPGTIKI